MQIYKISKYTNYAVVKVETDVIMGPPNTSD